MSVLSYEPKNRTTKHKTPFSVKYSTTRKERERKALLEERGSCNLYGFWSTKPKEKKALVTNVPHGTTTPSMRGIHKSQERFMEWRKEQDAALEAHKKAHRELQKKWRDKNLRTV